MYIALILLILISTLVKHSKIGLSQIIEIQSLKIMGNCLYIIIIGGVILGFYKIIKEANEKKQIAEQDAKKKFQDEAIQKKRISDRLTELKKFSNQIDEIKLIKVNDVIEFKDFISVNEKQIIEKGGEEKLFQFLKINTFLIDFRTRVINDINSFTEDFNEKKLEAFIIKYEQDNSLESITRKLNDRKSQIEGKNGTTINSKIERLFKNSDSIKPAINNEIETLDFYKSLALAMLVFYLSDKKIRFFEIFEAFNNMGALDSSWQKNVASKLNSIDMRLFDINNKLTEMNEGFIRLSENTGDLIGDLKQGLEGLNNKFDANNLLQAIATYQVYKINKNTKTTK